MFIYNGTVKHVGFCGPSAIYAKFRIEETGYNQIIVAHEGRWCEENGMCCHPHFANYEDVQASLGSGLVFQGKEYVNLIHRSLFKFEYDDTNEHILVVPATGEEISLEIYGVKYNQLDLLWKGEI